MNFLLGVLTLAAESGGEEEKFDPSHEFELPAWVPIHIGPLDMSINKAVVYLWIGCVLTILIGVLLMRWKAVIPRNLALFFFLLPPFFLGASSNGSTSLP